MWYTTWFCKEQTENCNLVEEAGSTVLGMKDSVVSEYTVIVKIVLNLILDKGAEIKEKVYLTG